MATEVSNAEVDAAVCNEAGETYEVVELEESDDDFAYEEVQVLSEGEEVDDGISEDLDSALRHLEALKAADTAGAAGAAEEAELEGEQELPPGAVGRKPEVIDDFFRNFLVRTGLQRTLQIFETEWYELRAEGKMEVELPPVPDVYIHNQDLQERVDVLCEQLTEAKAIAARASSTWDRFRKERDFHRMHHKRVAQDHLGHGPGAEKVRRDAGWELQEKNKLIQDIKRLKQHYSMYEPTIQELRKKYEAALKDKMLVRIDRDKLLAKVRAMEVESTAAEAATAAPDGAASAAKPKLQPSATGRSGAGSSGSPQKGGEAAPSAGAAPSRAVLLGALPAGPRKNPFAELEFDPAQVKSFTMQKSFKGHLLPVSNVVVHPSKPIVVTTSDDRSWRMWMMPDGDLIMSGEGHSDWVAGAAFHPQGLFLATGSGDTTVKLWDFEKQECVQTFSDHHQAVWGVDFHDMGEVVASCSLDHSARLWDLVAGKCRQAFRGHVDSVNEVKWQPYTSNLCTASSDKTVSVWDARSGLCAQTFFGHLNSCNSCCFSLDGRTVASSDADGSVVLWDVRMGSELLTAKLSEHPCNRLAMDRSGRVLAVACDDGRVHCIAAADGEAIAKLQGHEDAVQAVAFDPRSTYMVTCGSDNTFRTWS